MSKLIPIFDNGHGGIIGGVYQTPGKRSPSWSKGILYEGAFNRWIVNRLMEKMDRNSIPYFHVSPELEDVALKTRTDRGNKIYATNKNAYILSLHANAGGGSGLEGFTTVGKTKSDEISEKFLKAFEKEGITIRSDKTDGDLDKESDFWMLRVPNCPAVLIELGFMDNMKDYNELWDIPHLEKLVNIIYSVIYNLYNEQ